MTTNTDERAPERVCRSELASRDLLGLAHEDQHSLTRRAARRLLGRGARGA